VLALIQRVSSASVVVDGIVVGEIDGGIMLLLGIQKTDEEYLIAKLLSKTLDYRIFGDDKGHMNLRLPQIRKKAYGLLFPLLHHLIERRDYMISL
jgi:D-tyrosyl-tRNA(Tyr) deacylase